MPVTLIERADRAMATDHESIPLYNDSREALRFLQQTFAGRGVSAAQKVSPKWIKP
jgi:hypothetical protein